MSSPRSTGNLGGRAWLALKIVVAIALVGFIISKVSLPELGLLFARISLAWLTLSFVLFCLLTVIKAYQYYLLTGQQVPFARVLYVVIIQNAVSNFIAGGAGIMSYLTMLTVDDGLRLRRVVSSFIIVKVGDLAAVWLVLLTTSMLLWRDIGTLRAAVVFLLLVILAAIAVFLAAVLLRQRFVAAVMSALRMLKVDGNPWMQRGLGFLEMLASQETALLLRSLRIGLMFSLAYMAVTLAWFYANIRAYALVFPFVNVSFVNAFIQLISWVPIQVFGGLGVSEASLVFLFGVFGVPATQVAALGIGLRLILYVFTLLVLAYVPFTSLFKVRMSGTRLPKKQGG